MQTSRVYQATLASWIPIASKSNQEIKFSRTKLISWKGISKITMLRQKVQICGISHDNPKKGENEYYTNKRKARFHIKVF